MGNKLISRIRLVQKKIDRSPGYGYLYDDFFIPGAFVLVDELGKGESYIDIFDDSALDGYTLVPWHSSKQY